MQEVTLEEYRRLVKKQSKYRNERTAAGFDSKAEERRYEELLLLEAGGAISGLERQPAYVLQEAFMDASGKRWSAITYVADFAYSEGGRRVAEDVKGARTKEFRIKEKLFRRRYPEIDFRVLEV